MAVLHHLDGYTQDGIAASLDMSRKTVGKILAKFEDHVKKRAARLGYDGQRRAMADRTLTDLELERQLAGDLAAARFAEATDADRARLVELRAEHEAFLRSVDVDMEVKRIQQRVARAEPEKRIVVALARPRGHARRGGRRHPRVRLAPQGSNDGPIGDDIQVKGVTITLIVHLATSGGQRAARRRRHGRRRRSHPLRGRRAEAQASSHSSVSTARASRRSTTGRT